MAGTAEIATVVTVSPLTVRSRGSADAMPAKLLNVNGPALAANDQVAYVLLDPIETVGTSGETKQSGTALVLGKYA